MHFTQRSSRLLKGKANENHQRKEKRRKLRLGLSRLRIGRGKDYKGEVLKDVAVNFIQIGQAYPRYLTKEKMGIDSDSNSI